MHDDFASRKKSLGNRSYRRENKMNIISESKDGSRNRFKLKESQSSNILKINKLGGGYQKRKSSQDNLSFGNGKDRA